MAALETALVGRRVQESPVVDLVFMWQLAGYIRLSPTMPCITSCEIQTSVCLILPSGAD
jgi:hypothetical protein